MISKPVAVGLTCALAIPGLVLAVAASDDEPAMYHLAEDTDALWSNTAPGRKRMPTINIADDIYPDGAGVQFLIDDEPDDRNPRSRPDGFDATGPQDDSTFHVYPQIDLTVGMALEARWHDRDGDAHRTTWVVGESRFVFGLVGPDLATWTGVDAGKPTEPTIVIDPSIYPNETGVQFIIDGVIQDRSNARPMGFDPTGPQEGSRYHVYPSRNLRDGMQVEARWIDRNRQGRSSVFIVGSGAVVPPPTTVPTSTNVPPTSTSLPTTSSTAPQSTIVVTLPPTTTIAPIVTTPPPDTTTAPATTQPPATTLPPATIEPPETTVVPQNGGVGQLGSWLNVEPGTHGLGDWATFTPDQSVYPVAPGVQFWLNGQIDERHVNRPNGYDPTGENEGSTYHLYPEITLSGGDVLEAKWTDQSGVSHSSRMTVDGTSTISPSPAPSPAPSPTEPPATTGLSVCSLSNPNEPTDDPNALYNGTEGRDIVSSAPVPAGYPTPLTTGLCGVGIQPESLTPTGGMTITTDGTVIDGMDINGTVHIYAKNVTIRNSRITSGGSYTLWQHGGASGLLIEDTRIRAAGTGIAVRLYEYATIRRTHITGGVVNLMASNGMLLEDSYLTGVYRTPGAHNDVVWSRSGSNYILRNNTMIAAWKRGTSAIFFHTALGTGGGPVDDVLIEDNYISGGGYSVYMTKDYFPFTNGRTLNNRIELDSYRWGWLLNTSGSTSSGNSLLPSN